MKNYIFICVLFIFASVVYCQDKFEVKKIGFSIDIPNKWIKVSNDEIIENLNKYDFTDEQLDELLKANNADVSLGAFTKYDPKKVAGIIPTIKIRTQNNPTKNNKDFLRFVQLSAESGIKALDNFKIVDAPKSVIISEKQVVKFSVQFTLKNAGKEYEIISKSYYIPKNNYFISLNFIEQIGKEDNSELFEELVKSIKLIN